MSKGLVVILSGASSVGKGQIRKMLPGLFVRHDLDDLHILPRRGEHQRHPFSHEPPPFYIFRGRRELYRIWFA